MTFSRQALAAITRSGLMFEAILMAGFGLQIAEAEDYTDPRITYLLHELGEETRHSRLFARMLDQLGPRRPTPSTTGSPTRSPAGWSTRSSTTRRCCTRWCWRARRSPTCCRSGPPSTPDTDPFVREVNRYHRQEEARHLSFARTRLPEVWESAGIVDKPSCTSRRRCSSARCTRT